MSSSGTLKWGRVAVLAFSVTGGAAVTEAQQALPEIGAKGVSGWLLRKANNDKMLVRTPQGLTKGLSENFPLMCNSDGTLTKEAHAAIVLGLAVIREDHFDIGRSLLFADGLPAEVRAAREKFMQDNLPYTFSVQKKFEENIRAHLKANPEFEQQIREKLKTAEENSGVWGALKRRSALAGTAELVCRSKAGMETLVSQAVEGVRFDEIAREIEAARIKFGIAKPPEDDNTDLKVQPKP